jgi:hypothetical protein
VLDLNKALLLILTGNVKLYKRHHLQATFDIAPRNVKPFKQSLQAISLNCMNKSNCSHIILMVVLSLFDDLRTGHAGTIVHASAQSPELWMIAV